MLKARVRPHLYRLADGSTLVRWWDAGSRLRASHPDAFRLVAFINGPSHHLATQCGPTGGEERGLFSTSGDDGLKSHSTESMR
jgi:hypothetical protein